MKVNKLFTSYMALNLLCFLFFQSCSNTLSLYTDIRPDNRLIIGDNAHAAFHAKIKNRSIGDLVINRRNGASILAMDTIKARNKMEIDVPEHSELVIQNNNRSESKVNVHVKTTDDSAVRSRKETIR